MTEAGHFVQPLLERQAPPFRSGQQNIVEIEPGDGFTDDGDHIRCVADLPVAVVGQSKRSAIVKDGRFTSFCHLIDEVIAGRQRASLGLGQAGKRLAQERYLVIAAKIDDHGAVVASVRMTTTAGAATEENVIYAAFGERTKGSAGNAGTPVSASDLLGQKFYIGERYDAATGLIYLNAR